MKKLLVISTFVCLAIGGHAQQQYTFTNFMMNDYYYSPAVAGMKNVHLANIGYRSQWTGFDEAPKTLYANFYGSVNNKGKHGYGVSILNDRSGLVSNTGFLVNYVYHLKINQRQKLAFVPQLAVQLNGYQKAQVWKLKQFTDCWNLIQRAMDLLKMRRIK